MGRLDHAIVYSCGQVEVDSEAAVWRTQLSKDLATINPFIKHWDPLVKPEWMSPAARGLTSVNILNPIVMFQGAERQQKIAWDANTEIRHVCQGLAGQANLFVARITRKFTWGSIDELEIASRRHIPVFFVFPDGPVGLYGMPGIVKRKLLREYIHYNMESLLDKLRAIDNGTCGLPERDPDRWLFITYPDATRVAK